MTTLELLDCLEEAYARRPHMVACARVALESGKMDDYRGCCDDVRQLDTEIITALFDWRGTDLLVADKPVTTGD